MFKKQIKIKQLVHSANKSGRGVNFQIYTNGVIMIQGIGSQYGINIPAQLRQWIKLPVTKKQLNWKLKVKLEIINEQEMCVFNNISTTLVFKSDQWLIRPNNISFKGKSLGSMLSERVKLVCSLLLPRSLWSEKYKQAAQMLDSSNYNNDSDYITVVSGGKATGYYEVIQDKEGQFIIKLETSMSESGGIQFPAELARVFKNWTTNKELFLCIFEDGHKQIVEAKFVTDKSRPDRIRKTLNLTYNGERKRVSIICYSQNLELTPKMKKDFELKKMLVKLGCPLKSLKANHFSVGKHYDKQFEEEVRTLFTNAFKNAHKTILDEVALSPNYPEDSLKIENEFTFDLLLFLKNKQLLPSELLILVEIKSSLKKSKNKVLCDSIANLKYYQVQLGEENVLPILIINDVFNKRNPQIIDTYSFKTGVLILDKNKLDKFIDHPNLLSKTILSFKQKREQLRSNPLFTIHPLTQELVSKENLQNEALALLMDRKKDGMSDRKTLTAYCLLMNIRKSDFYRLYNSFESKYTEINNGSPVFISNEIIKKRKLNFKAIHQLLCEKGSVAAIPEKPQNCLNKSYNTLASNIKQITRILPTETKIVGFKDYQHKGKSYERFIQKRLELLNYQVIPNVLVYVAGRLMEIDLFALKEDELKLVSCKNMSSFQDFPQTTVAIKRAVKLLTFNKQILNADQGLVYIKVNKQFRDIFKNKFNNKVFTDNIEVKITD